MFRQLPWTTMLTALLLAAGPAPAVDSSSNAALRYWRAWTQITPDLEDAAHEAALSWQEDDAWQATLDPDLRAALEEDSILVTTILRATALPECDFAADIEDGFFTILPHLGSLRVTARLLAIDARLASESGDVGQAVSRLSAGYAVAHHAGQEPFLISGLVSAAVFSLIDGEVAALVDSGAVTPLHKMELLAVLDRFETDDPFGLRHGVEGEAKATTAWIGDALNRPGGAEEAARLIAEDWSEADEESWQDLLLLVQTQQGYEEAMAQLARYYSDVLGAWGEAEGTERIEGVGAAAKAKEYGILAYWYAPNLAKVHQNFMKSRASLAAAKERLR